MAITPSVASVPNQRHITGPNRRAIFAVLVVVFLLLV
jgi:hypothetical protein